MLYNYSLRNKYVKPTENSGISSHIIFCCCFVWLVVLGKTQIHDHIIWQF